MAVNAFELRHRTAANDRARRVNEARRKLPKQMRAYVEDLERRYAKKAAPIARKRDKEVAAIQKKKGAAVAERDRLAGEIDQAKANLADIPVGASASKIAEWKAVVDYWPSRQGEASEKINALQHQSNEIEKQANVVLRHLQSELDLEAREAIRDLQAVFEFINIYALANS